METAQLEQRLARVEADVEQLKAKLNGLSDGRPWWEKVYGSFAGEPAFKEAMRLGREYRESLRPRPRKRRKRS
jgi:hypothetical protein